MAEALEDVEQRLESNLQLRLDVRADWVMPTGKVVAGYREPDARWLEAKALLDQDRPEALTAFMNLDYKKRNNPAAREWHAYALAKFGKERQVHDIIALLNDVVEADNFSPIHHGMARWNLAVALSSLPGRSEEALNALLPMLEFDSHPPDALDLAMLWATEERRIDILRSLFLRSRHFESHLLLALWAARDALREGAPTIDGSYLRRVGAILADSGDLPHPLEQIAAPRLLDELVERFIRLIMVDAGIEWFSQRLSSSQNAGWFKNWECLANLYEAAGDLDNTWKARRLSVTRSVRRAKSKPREVLKGVEFTLRWALQNGFRAEALRELREWSEAVSMPLHKIAIWQEKLGVTASNQGAPQLGGMVLAAADQTSAAASESIQPVAEPRETIDTVAPIFNQVKSAQQLADRRQDAESLLDAATALSRAGAPEVVRAIRQILELVSEGSGGVPRSKGDRSIAVFESTGKCCRNIPTLCRLRSEALLPHACEPSKASRAVSARFQT